MIESEESLPQVICNSCLKVLLSVENLRKVAQESDRCFRELLIKSEPETFDDYVEAEEPTCEIFIDPCFEIKEEPAKEEKTQEKVSKNSRKYKN